MGFSCAVITGTDCPLPGAIFGLRLTQKGHSLRRHHRVASYLMLAYISNLVQFYFVVSVCMGLGMATRAGSVASLSDKLV